MKNLSVKIRLMRPSDVPAAMRLKNSEGWNQTEKDWQLLLEHVPDLCLVAEYGQEIIGTVTAINYSDDVAWIGMMLVDRRFRGLGVSKQLLKNILIKLEPCKSVKLDATPAGHPVYRKLGFIDEYKIYRLTTPSLNNSLTDDGEISARPIQSQELPEITEFDRGIFGADRIRLLGSLLANHPDRGWLLKKDNQIAAYALGRPGSKFNQVGPACALTTDDAKDVIKRALTGLVGQQVVVDILCDKNGLLDWLVSVGFTRQRHLVRMYYKENPFPGLIQNQFLISGPEFG
jgi:predicted N-acetyltransferase YhbS